MLHTRAWMPRLAPFGGRVIVDLAEQLEPPALAIVYITQIEPHPLLVLSTDVTEGCCPRSGR